MIHSIILLVIFASNVALAATSRPPACSLSNVLDCDTAHTQPANLNGKMGLPTRTDGTVFFNFFALSKNMKVDEFSMYEFPQVEQRFLETMAKPSAQQTTKLLQLAEDLRRRAIEMVRGEPDGALLVQRLETVKFSMAEEFAEKCVTEVPQGFPNASYLATIHMIEMCPSIAKLNREAAIMSIAHEIGHVIQPCFSRKTMFIVDPEKASQSAIGECDSDFASQLESGSRRIDGIRGLRMLAEGQVRHVVGSLNDPMISRLSSCGILKEVPAPAAGKGTPFFERSQTCIDRVNATIYEREIEALTPIFAESNRVPTNVAREQARADTPAACLDKTVEHSADSFASRLMATVAESENWNQATVRAAMLPTAGLACFTESKSTPPSPEYPHPSDRVRVLLNDARLADRLGCDVAPDSNLCSMAPADVRSTGAGSTSSRSGNARPAGSRPAGGTR